MLVSRSQFDIAAQPDYYYLQTRSEMDRFVPSTAKRILDVGCAQGLFGQRLKERLGAEVWGLEIVPSAATIARQRLDHVLCGDVLEQFDRIQDNYFDCIIFNDVIEHLVDPYRVLLETRKKLARGGVVVCSIPNIRFFRYLFKFVVHGEWHYDESGVMDKTHLRFFTKKSIREMFESLGYRLVLLEGINPTPSWRVRLLSVATLGSFEDTRYQQFACVAKPEE